MKHEASVRVIPINRTVCRISFSGGESNVHEERKCKYKQHTHIRMYVYSQSCCFFLGCRFAYKCTCRSTHTCTYTDGRHMHVHPYKRTCTQKHTAPRMHTDVHANAHLHIKRNTHACIMHAHTHACACIYKHAHTHTWTCAHTHTRLLAHTRTNTCTHSHIYT